MGELKDAVTKHQPGKLDHLEAKVQAQSDEIRILKKRATANLRNNNLYEALAQEINRVAPKLKPGPVFKKPVRKGKVIEDLVLHISDAHADQIVMPHRVGELEDYNFQVFMARAEKLIDKVLDYALNTMQGYSFPRLWILFNGDHINGEIHNSTAHSEYKNALRNTLAVGQIMGQMIRDLSCHFADVKTVWMSGNHGRRSIKKDYESGAWNNWDYLVAETAKTVCMDLSNVSFLIPDAWTVNLQIAGYWCNIQHGDDVKAWNGIPYYGMERQTRRLLALETSRKNRAISYFFRGHFHSSSSLSHPGGEVLMNGSWKAVDPYTYNAFAGYTEPVQLLHGMHERHGVTWRLPVRLRFDGDVDGPKRYKVNLENYDGKA